MIDKESSLLLSEVTDHPSKDCPNLPSDSGVVSSTEKGRTSIAKAIESYLKDVEPSQREQKTYDEYRLVLYKFRDTRANHHEIVSEIATLTVSSHDHFSRSSFHSDLPRHVPVRITVHRLKTRFRCCLASLLIATSGMRPPILPGLSKSR